MGSYAGVYVQGKEVFSWRNEIDPTFLFLFTKDDIKRAPKDPDEMLSDDDVEFVQLVTTAQVLVDRLDVLGIGPTLIEEVFRDAVEYELELVKGMHSPQLDRQAEIDFLEELTLETWLEHVAAALASGQTIHDRHRRFDDPTSLASLFNLLDGYDPRYFLRALLLACDPTDQIMLDVTELIDGGWVPHDVDPQTVALEHFSYALANGSPAVVITEGSTDIAALEATIRLRFPHLQSFIRFFDFGEGAEGSATAGIRTIKSFAAAGISNRVMLILDNDTAARDAERALRGTHLPEHYSVLHYPELDLANQYPTLGPDGPNDRNVNGLAGSIELYLGTDVLTRDDGTLTPVQWRSYLDGVGAYQGEVIDKAKIRRKFVEKVKAATAKPEVMRQQDWTGLEAIIQTIITDLRSGAK